jgi:hypothetical protein
MKKCQEQQTELKASKNVVRGIQITAFCQGNEIGSERTCDEFEYLPPLPQPKGPPCAVGSAEALLYIALCLMLTVHTVNSVYQVYIKLHARLLNRPGKYFNFFFNLQECCNLSQDIQQSCLTVTIKGM